MRERAILYNIKYYNIILIKYNHFKLQFIQTLKIKISRNLILHRKTNTAGPLIDEVITPFIIIIWLDT